ncbi:hypothetical protein CBA19CS42_12235 [Caballeronia novacaledonica]|uniref:Uncharacterized protein n=1 Tax=Caballeronia novacaledonica TaxID=1544861 RepID=A0AA37I8G1_9BURK|nr:hypothetical protein CBA19CS42_12235 [Caballeronia novacaledonica]
MTGKFACVDILRSETQLEAFQRATTKDLCMAVA